MYTQINLNKKIYIKGVFSVKELYPRIKHKGPYNIS